MLKTDPTPAVEMKMQPEDFASLRADVATVKERDVHLGRVLESMLLHLGHAHDLDPAVEDARLAKKTRADARAAEDTRLKDEAEARAERRSAEDGHARTPLEREILLAARGVEDAQVKADAVRLKARRQAEDGATA